MCRHMCLSVCDTMCLCPGVFALMHFPCVVSFVCIPLFAIFVLCLFHTFSLSSKKKICQDPLWETEVEGGGGEERE